MIGKELQEKVGMATIGMYNMENVGTRRIPPQRISDFKGSEPRVWNQDSILMNLIKTDGLISDLISRSYPTSRSDHRLVCLRLKCASIG